MRLVPINCIREGSFLAKTIYDVNGRVLLRSGYKLNYSLLRSIQQNGIYSLYINDEYSQNEIEDLVKPELRQKAINTIKDSFSAMKKYRENTFSNIQNNRYKNSDIQYTNLKKIMQIANDIVEEILYKNDILINLVDIKSMDNYTYQHSINVTILAIVLGIELKYDKKKLVEIAIGGLLHDIGKVFIPKEVLLKNDKLDDNEFNVIKTHTIKGYDYMKESCDISILSRNIILYHHEKVDGSGYPEGIKDNKIHSYVKITAIADVYDALTSDRPYRKSMSPNEAIEFIMGSAGRHFDYNLVSLFIKRIIPYPIGTLVQLSNGAIGVIEEINGNYPLRPKIRLVDIDSKKLSNSIIDLLNENSIIISNIIYNIALN